MNATSAVSVAFDPLLPWTVLAVLGGIGLVLVLLGLRAGARGTIWRLGSLVIVLAALANPALIEEQRKPIADVALVVVDDSDSMAIGERRQQVQAAREALKRKLGQQEGLEVREAVLPPSHIQLGSERPGGTRLIETMRSALVEVPPERLAGVVLLSDGQVHDVPAGLPPELGGAPLHALIAGKKNERDRLIVLEQSPRFGVVGREVTTKFRIEDPAGGTAPVTLSVGGEVVRRLDVPVGKLGRAADHGRQSRRQRRRARSGARPQRAHARQQPRAVHHQRRARPAARAAGVGRALPGRAGVAEPAEERSRGRPGALHHPAHAAEGRFHAGARAVADRLPDARAVRAEAQGIRPHHLRPLRIGQPDHARLFPQHRRIREGRRRAAGLGRAGVRHAALALPHAARRHAAGGTAGRRAGDAVQAQGHRDRPAPSRHRQPAAGRRPREGAGMGPLVPPGHLAHRARQRHPVRRRRPAAGGARPGGRRPRGAAAVRSPVAVEPRHRRRRAAARAGAPGRALADEGARPRGGGAARHRRSAAASK